MRALVVGDDPSTVRYQVQAIRGRSLAVDGARTGQAAAEAWARVDYDALVVGLGLADGDGRDLVGRARGRATVVVMAANGPGADALGMLGDGVDDCVALTAGADEVALRLVKAVVRRTGPAGRVRLGRALVDRNRRHVTVDGTPVVLSTRQMCVFDHLVAHRRRIVAPEELFAHCWDDRADMFSNPVPTQISRLRHTLAGAVDIVWTGGTGYLLAVTDGTATDDQPGDRDATHPLTITRRPKAFARG